MTDCHSENGPIEGRHAAAYASLIDTVESLEGNAQQHVQATADLQILSLAANG